MGEIHINIPARSIGRSAAADAWLDQFKTRERIMNDLKKTPDIAAMTMNELAEYVVTLDGWEWMKGIVDEDGDVMVGGTMMCLITVNGGTVEDQPSCRPTPDLTDPATLGCLLAMVRAMHGASVSTEMWGDSRWSVNVAMKLSHGMHQHHIVRKAPTEAHALVAALAKGAS